MPDPTNITHSTEYIRNKQLAVRNGKLLSITHTSYPHLHDTYHTDTSLELKEILYMPKK